MTGMVIESLIICHQPLLDVVSVASETVFSLGLTVGSPWFAVKQSSGWRKCNMANKVSRKISPPLSSKTRLYIYVPPCYNNRKPYPGWGFWEAGAAADLLLSLAGKNGTLASCNKQFFEHSSKSWSAGTKTPSAAAHRAPESCWWRQFKRKTLPCRIAG